MQDYNFAHTQVVVVQNFWQKGYFELVHGNKIIGIEIEEIKVSLPKLDDWIQGYNSL